MPKSTTPKLNDTQLIILSSATQSEAGLAVLPESLKASAAKAAVTKLLGLGFLKEVRVKRDQPAWRNDDEDKSVGLKIMKAGSAAIGVSDEVAAEDEPAPEPKGRGKPKQQAPEEPTASREPRPGSKQAQIIALMRNQTRFDRQFEAQRTRGAFLVGRRLLRLECITYSRPPSRRNAMRYELAVRTIRGSHHENPSCASGFRGSGWVGLCSDGGCKGSIRNHRLHRL
jgi:hypothetical protein